MALFQPRCPVGERERAWIEDNMRWLRAEFGEGPLAAPVILPASDFFPPPYSGSRVHEERHQVHPARHGLALTSHDFEPGKRWMTTAWHETQHEPITWEMFLGLDEFCAATWRSRTATRCRASSAAGSMGPVAVKISALIEIFLADLEVAPRV